MRPAFYLLPLVLVAATGFSAYAEKPEKSSDLIADLPVVTEPEYSSIPYSIEEMADKTPNIIVVEGLMNLEELPPVTRRDQGFAENDKPIPVGTQVEEYSMGQVDGGFSIVPVKVVSVQKGNLKPGDVIKLIQNVYVKDGKIMSLGGATPVRKGSQYSMFLFEMKKEQSIAYDGAYLPTHTSAKINIDGSDDTEIRVVGRSKKMREEREKFKGKVGARVNFDRADEKVKKIKIEK